MTDSNHPVSAKTPTREEIEADRDWALTTHSTIVSKIRETRVTLWEVAKRLHEWDDRRGWLKTGNYETLGEWLGDPDIAMSKSNYYRLLAAYRTLVIDHQLPEATVFELETSKVDVVLKAVRDHDVQVGVAVSDIQTLSKSDLIQKYHPAPDPDDEDEGPDDVFDPEDVEAGPDAEVVVEGDLIPSGDELELEPLEWACEGLRAILTPLEHDPWARAYVDAGRGVEGLEAVARVTLDALE